jgi:ATP-dependent Clp protease ATP-binding subunit ClpC
MNVFDRYTEAGRRVFFYAQQSAGDMGAPTIESDHLLSGLLRDSRSWIGVLDPLVAAELRRMLDSAPPMGPALPQHQDMPLSKDAKNAMRHAVQEADRLQHQQVSCEHLLLGLLHLPESRAGRLLARYGVTLERMRRSAGLPEARKELYRLVDELPDSLLYAAREALKRIRPETMGE